MPHLLIHTIFDALAWAVSLAVLLVLRRTWFPNDPVGEKLRLGYIAAIVFGAGIGAWGFGTLNLWFSGIHEIGRSIEGALAGAIFSIELYKKMHGVTARTGAVYALPIALGIAVGRIGCLLSGLEDQTHGIHTGADWSPYVGWDFGDGIPRHPVQLYESLAMAGFAATYAITVALGSPLWKTNGFYLMVGFYGLQRFGWEFLKPYEPVAFGLSVFQLLSLVLIAYAAERMATHRPQPTGTHAP